jgi:Transposase
MARKGYPAEFRRRALDLVAAGKSVAEVARLLEVSDQSINPTTALTSNALGMAVEQRESARGETVIHSDHGDAIHLLGIHGTGAAVWPRAFDGLGR